MLRAGGRPCAPRRCWTTASRSCGCSTGCPVSGDQAGEGAQYDDLRDGGATCGGPVPRSDACPPLPRSVGVHLTPQKTPCLMPSPYPGAWDAASALLPPTSRGPWGGPQGRCNRGTNATLSGTKHPPPPGPWDFPQPWGQPHPKCQAPSTWVRAGGGLGHSPHHGQATAGCGEGETCCPACSRGEGMAWFLSVCNFSSAFIKHQLIL